MWPSLVIVELFIFRFPILFSVPTIFCEWFHIIISFGLQDRGGKRRSKKPVCRCINSLMLLFTTVNTSGVIKADSSRMVALPKLDRFLAQVGAKLNSENDNKCKFSLFPCKSS